MRARPSCTAAPVLWAGPGWLWTSGSSGWSTRSARTVRPLCMVATARRVGSSVGAVREHGGGGEMTIMTNRYRSVQRDVRISEIRWPDLHRGLVAVSDRWLTRLEELALWNGILTLPEWRNLCWF